MNERSRTWLFDLDNTLHNASPHIFPHLNRSITAYICQHLKVDEDEPITARMVSNAIRDAQKRVEGHNFDIRKHLIDYDNVMNQQRTAIYTMRKEILAGKDIERKALDMLSEVTSGDLDTFIPEGSKRESWNLAGLVAAAQRHFGMNLKEEELAKMQASEITRTISEGVKLIYDAQKNEIGQFFEQLVRHLMLQTIDQRWKEHLERIDRMKEGIHLRAHAQKDPLIEYKKEAFATFQEMNMWIQEETVEKLLKIKLVSQERAREVLEERQEFDDAGLEYAGADENPNGYINTQVRPVGPVAQQAPPQNLMFGRGMDDDDDGPKMNREQRRRMKKDGKPKRRV